MTQSVIRKWWLCSAIAIFGALYNGQAWGAKTRVYFNDLKVVNGVARTERGGLFFSDQLQLQADILSFDEKKKSLEASQNLLFILNGQVFSASYLYINLTEKVGWFEDLTTKINHFYFSTKRLELDEEANLNFDQLEITPFEQAPLFFSFHVQKGSINQEFQLKTKGLSAQLCGVPLLYLPQLEWNLKELPSSAVRYRIQYNSQQYPQLSFRYPIIATPDNSALFRFDYRIAKGFGAAIESDSTANNKKLRLKTKNFVSYDTFYNDDNIKKLSLRYRFTGKFDSAPANKELIARFQYDVNSDRDLRQNFPVEQFEMADVMRTQGVFGWTPKFGQGYLTFHPRANNYESMSQQLPSLQIRLEPIESKPLGLFFNNQFSLSYLNYDFSKNLHGVLTPFSSGRLQTTQQLDWPLDIGALKIEPTALFSAIGYSATPTNQTEALIYFNYGVRASTIIEAVTTNMTHTVQPYVDFHACTRPNLSPTDHYIFSLNDGISPVQQLKTGLLNTLYLSNLNSTCTWDFYGLNFFSQSTFNVPFPKVKSFFTIDTPYCIFKNGFGYNFQENSIDLFTLECGWTLHKTFAFYLDWLYRGPFEWKKDDRSNYQLDVAYPIDTLRLTPLSDKRSTLISRLEWHFLPNWTLRFQHHNGFWRENAPPYFECQAELSTIFRSALDIRLSFIRSVNDSQVLFSLNLL